MKKKFLFVALLTVMSAALFCQVTDSKKGYFKLAWGSTVEEAKKAGYKLTKYELSSKTREDLLVPVDVYSVKPRESIVKSLRFWYFDGKLFYVGEMVQLQNVQSKIESRYGNFKKNGIYNHGSGIVTDTVFDNKNKIISGSITIQPSGSQLNVAMFDWNVAKKVLKYFRDSAADVGGTDSEGLVSALETLAKKLVNAGDDKVSTYAILKLSSDFNNVQYEEYITDILTEAIFNTGSVKIIERANLEKILKEQKLQASGLINEKTAKAVGMVSGADYVCYGSIKDIGSKFTIIARVVDVETGEICAMSRDTIEKDEYLLGSSGGSARSSETKSNRVSGKPVKTAWTLKKYRSEFDGCTIYTFICPCADGAFLFFGYEKRNNPLESRVRACQGNVYSDGYVVDIKLENGEFVHKELDYNGGNAYRWYLKSGTVKGSFDAERVNIYKETVDDARDFYNYFKENDSIIIRETKRDKIHSFQTAGFMAFLEQNGITDKEIMDAFANEEF